MFTYFIWDKSKIRVREERVIQSKLKKPRIYLGETRIKINTLRNPSLLPNIIIKHKVRKNFTISINGPKKTLWLPRGLIKKLSKGRKLKQEETWCDNMRTCRWISSSVFSYQKMAKKNQKIKITKVDRFRTLIIREIRIPREIS